MKDIYLFITKAFGYIAKKCKTIRSVLFRTQNKMTLYWLRKHYSDVLSTYRRIHFENTIPEYDDTIWTCWWQGEENAPETVQLCIESMRKNKGSKRNLIIINKDNWDSYISLPQVVIKKFDKGYMGITQLIDIIRVAILEAYGGMWLDASIFVMKEIPNKYFRTKYWTIKSTCKKIACISEGRWTNGVMASCRGSQFADYVKNMLIQYWGGEKILMNYFLVDCITYIAFTDFDWYRKDWNEIEIENDLFDMEPYFDLIYEKDRWDELVGNSYFYFMTRKRNYIYELDGKKTFYGYIKDNYRIE